MEFGLQTVFFTNSIDKQNDSFNKLNVSDAILNDAPTFQVDLIPDRGVKYTMLDMRELQLILANSNQTTIFRVYF